VSAGTALAAPPPRGRGEPALPAGPEVRLRTAAGVALVELDRPARGNALSATMVEALIGAVHAACADASVHTLAFCGTGRHFCTGFDLGTAEAVTDGELLLRFVRIETLLDAVWRAPVRTVAIAQGRAWGAGADLLAACDRRCVAPDASLRFPGAAFGIVLGTRRLAERVGTDRARAWVAEGTTLDAAGAVAAGLATALLPPVPEDAAARAGWREEAIGAPPVVDRATLAAIRSASRPAGGPGADALADADLAALVRSASRPGLAARLAAYRERARAAAARGPSD